MWKNRDFPQFSINYSCGKIEFFHTQLDCLGCWNVDLQYDADPGKPSDNYTTDRVTANITIQYGEVVDAVIYRGGINVSTDD
ncbi:MAG: hypothetical protein GQ477_04745 [Nanohaloarchaea archaeon]|nr:hypothetical protein [Candidatus Nanohaloarchaea archaeon]